MLAPCKLPERNSLLSKLSLFMASNELEGAKSSESLPKRQIVQLAALLGPRPTHFERHTCLAAARRFFSNATFRDLI